MASPRARSCPSGFPGGVPLSSRKEQALTRPIALFVVGHVSARYPVSSARYAPERSGAFYVTEKIPKESAFTFTAANKEGLIPSSCSRARPIRDLLGFPASPFLGCGRFVDARSLCWMLQEGVGRALSSHPGVWRALASVLETGRG